jgi:hypothetical protein
MLRASLPDLDLHFAGPSDAVFALSRHVIEVLHHPPCGSILPRDDFDGGAGMSKHCACLVHQWTA